MLQKYFMHMRVKENLDDLVASTLSNIKDSFIEALHKKSHYIIKRMKNWRIQPLKFTSAVGNCQGFCWGKQCFYRIHLGKNIAEVITYFTTKLLFTNKRYLLHVLEKCLYVLQEVRSIIYVRQFIHPLSLHSCGSGTSFTFTSYIII